jgi:hypothetical protein
MVIRSNVAVGMGFEDVVFFGPRMYTYKIGYVNTSYCRDEMAFGLLFHAMDNSSCPC